MEYNVISRYVDFLKREYHNFFKIMFGDKYQKKLCEPFLDRYICVRYFNETSFTSDKDIISRLNKELVDVYDSVVDDDNEEMIKNIVALFGYIIYFDDVCQVIEEAVLINVLAEDEDITIEHDHNIKKDIKAWYINFKKKKEKFNNTIMTRDFDLIEERLYRKIYYLVLKHNVKISNLYSEFAIDKAYNSGLINEDKLFITLILSSLLVLNNAINMDFSRYYVVADKDYSPTTMYNDYSINEWLFHMQSQSTTAEYSPTGQRYIHHKERGSRVLLFVREFKEDRLTGGAEAYTYLGTASYVKHEGSKPMNITWKLDAPIPAKYLKKTNKLVVG